MQAEQRFHKKSLYWAIIVACLIHAGLLAALFLAPASEPDFPYVPLAAMDFAPYDPDGGSPGGSTGNSPDNTSGNLAGGDGFQSPPASQPIQETPLAPDIPLSQSVQPKHNTQLPVSDQEPEPELNTSQPRTKVVESKAENSEEIVPSRVKKQLADRQKTTGQKPSSQPAHTPRTDQPRPSAQPVQQGKPGLKNGATKDGVTGATSAGEGRGGTGEGTGAGNPDVEKAYLGHIMQKLNRYKKYPSAARSQRAAGTVTVRFTIDSQGRVTASELVKSSGFSALDQEAMSLLQRVSPFKRIPAAMGREHIMLTVPIAFSVR